MEELHDPHWDYAMRVFSIDLVAQYKLQKFYVNWKKSL